MPVALGFGIATPEHAAAAAAAGADGVIVGSRLVRAAGEGPTRPPRCASWGARGRSPPALIGRVRAPWASPSPPPLGLVIWIVLWSLGAKSFDAFLITMLVVLVAAMAKVIVPTLVHRPPRAANARRVAPSLTHSRR